MYSFFDGYLDNFDKRLKKCRSFYWSADPYPGNPNTRAPLASAVGTPLSP